MTENTTVQIPAVKANVLLWAYARLIINLRDITKAMLEKSSVAANVTVIGEYDGICLSTSNERNDPQSLVNLYLRCVAAREERFTHEKRTGHAFPAPATAR